MAKNKYSYSDSQNTSILTNIFNNVTKKNTDEVNSVLDPLSEKTSEKKTNIYESPNSTDNQIKKDISEPIATANIKEEVVEKAPVVEESKNTQQLEEPFKFDFASKPANYNNKDLSSTKTSFEQNLKPKEESIKIPQIEKKEEIKTVSNNYNSKPFPTEVVKSDVITPNITPSLKKHEKTDIEEDIVKHNNDIHSMFERINNNVKEATDIFNQNISMRNKLVKDFEQLEVERNSIVEEKANFERRVNEEYKRLNQKKEEQDLKLSESKKILEREIEKLNINNQKLEQERNIFETKKNEEYHRFNQYKEKEEQIVKNMKNDLELEKEKLELRVNELEEEKRRFKISQVKLDNERNELTINLNKFNELVNNFTFGISKLPNE